MGQLFIHMEGLFAGSASMRVTAKSFASTQILPDSETFHIPGLPRMYRNQLNVKS
jgi:hypothetical protein